MNHDSYTTSRDTIFTAKYDAQYETVPSLATIAGTYSGRAGSPLGVESGTITVSAAGAITAFGASGCNFTGTVTPRTKGNAYNTTVTFGGAPCFYPGTTFTGGAYYDAPTRRLYSVILSSTRNAGFIFAGTKP